MVRVVLPIKIEVKGKGTFAPPKEPPRESGK